MPSWVAVGPGDDAAVVEPARGTLDVLTTDVLVEGVHFDRRFVPPEAIGHRALAVNLSDLAAMGAEPRLALLSLALPDALEVSAVDGILDGLLAIAHAHRVTLVGGNVSRSPGPLIVDISASGTVRRRRVMTRSGAGPGDDVYVTGTIGDALVGLRSFQEKCGRSTPQAERADHEVASSRCEQRYLRPEPRVRAGVLLGRNRAASACIDLSDGLADGLRQLADASQVGIQIEAEALPIADDVRQWHTTRGNEVVTAALDGGDDYELLFAVRPMHRGRIRAVRRHVSEPPMTRIGVVTRERRLLVRTPEGERPLPEGFEHFR